MICKLKYSTIKNIKKIKSNNNVIYKYIFSYYYTINYYIIFYTAMMYYMVVDNIYLRTIISCIFVPNVGSLKYHSLLVNQHKN